MDQFTAEGTGWRSLTSKNAGITSFGRSTITREGVEVAELPVKPVEIGRIAEFCFQLLYRRMTQTLINKWSAASSFAMALSETPGFVRQRNASRGVTRVA
jgi:hypothetical protein